jgi:phosphohistidine phosphatase
MKRRLILMRHAKSDWHADVADDHARPLNARGRLEGPKVAKRIAEIEWTPELIISSDSQRTMETAELLTAAIGAVPINYTRELYHAGPDQVRAALAGLDDATRTVLLLGHNPGWEEALEWLTGTEETLKTSTAALLSGPDKPWPELVKSKARFELVSVLRAKEL